MLTRLTHAAIAFAVTVAVYQAYVLAVVPLVEPADISQQTVQAISLEQLRQPPARLKEYEPLLRAYFPPDHWCLRLPSPPKIIESPQAMIVIDDYQQTDNGVLRVPRCAVVFFPNGRDLAGPPPRDAIVLEPADGATLQMDQTLNQSLRLDGSHAVRTTARPRHGPQRHEAARPRGRSARLKRATCT